MRYADSTLSLTLRCIASAFALAVVAVGLPACTAVAKQEVHYHRARPVTAELQIWTVGPDGKVDWITQQRIKYDYPKNSKPETEETK